MNNHNTATKKRIPRKEKKKLKRSGLLMDGRPGMTKPYWSHQWVKRNARWVARANLKGKV